MGKNTDQIISEVWDSMNYTLPNTGYFERAKINGVMNSQGKLPSLSWNDILKNLNPYFMFSKMQGGKGLEDSYINGKGISSNIIIEVTYEVDSDLTKRLDPNEESELMGILEKSKVISNEDTTKLMELGGWSIPLISAKVSYSNNEHKESLEKVRKALLYSGLEKV